jgi:glycosyltransferase involved in cell wall biosynthesis
VIGFGLSTFLRLLVSRRVAVTHVGDMASWPLAFAASLRGSDVIISAHGSDVSYPLSGQWLGRAYRAYLRLGAALLPKARIAANSKYIAELAAAAGFRDVRVIRMGTDLAPTGSKASTGHLLFAGRISRAKGLRFLVEEVLPALGPDIRLRVAGTVWDESEAELLHMRGVDWLGPLTARQIAHEYASSLAVLVPSRAPEGFGLVAAEAAASGGVVIAADHSGLAEAVTPETGFLERAGDAPAWISRIEAIRAWTPAQRAAFVRRSGQAARRLYDWQRVAYETAQLYESASSPAPASALAWDMTE